MIRLIAIDIDGTLLDSRYQLPPANVEALRHAHRRGIEIVLVTGRRHSFALPIARALGVDPCIISSNGAITRTMEGETFHRDLMPAAATRQLCAHMDDFRGNMVITFDREGKGALALEGLEQLSRSISRWLETNHECIEVVRPIEESLARGHDPVQAMFCGDLARMQHAARRLAAGTVMEHITLLRTEYPARDLYILDVMNRCCSKGHALERWAKARAISASEVAAIGDNHNDVQMLNFAGRAFIMGNACDELKQNGWTLAPSNDADGVAAAVEQVLD